MAHLLLDIGNTRTKAVIMDNGKVLQRLVSDNFSQFDLHALVEHYNIDAAAASVVGMQPDFGCLLDFVNPSRFHLLTHQSRLPIAIDYDTPSTLGMDRIAAVVGARQLCPSSPLLVVDAGSCITIDLLDDNNCYQGGAILPGLRMKFRALHEFTAALPDITLTPDELNGSTPQQLTGKSTRGSITSGVCNATLFEIQGFIAEYNRAFPSLKLFLTGGDADFFANQLFFPKFATPDLLMIGLDKILEMNI